MGLTFDAAERLFQLGEFHQLIESTDSSRTLDPRHAILLAHALAHAGELSRARRLAQGADEPHATLTVRSGAHVVLGIAAENSGEMSAAVEHFQLATRLANLAKDDVQIAWAQLRLFRHLIDRSSTNAVMGMLPEVRRATTRAGNAHVTAYLHQCISMLEGQVGRIDEARRHCDIVDGLLIEAPNLWLATGNLLNRACLALLECAYDDATKYLSDERFDLMRTGSRAMALETNLGHCQTLTGQFERALATQRRIASSPKAPHVAVIGSFEGTARVHLALGKLDDCELALRHLDAEIAKDPALTHTFHVRWSIITQARLLLKRGQATEAARLIRLHEARVGQIDDPPLKSLIHMTLAQALAQSGRNQEVAFRLIEARRLGIMGFRELQAQCYYASASVLSKESTLIRDTLKRRAHDLWQHQGIVSLRLEMDTNDNLSVAGPMDCGERPSSAASEVASWVVESIAAVMDLAHTPKLMGKELLAIIDATECSHAELLEARVKSKTGNAEQTPSPRMLIPLGRSRQRTLALNCSVPADPEKGVVLAAISRLAEAATALERSREDERKRSALWPAERHEEQAGALFVADDMQSLLATARRVATTNVPVLITGETGTGKEVLARTIHAYSTRAKRTFIPFNCTSTPRDMLDSQLFGHRRGSFTGAMDNFQGIIRAAGTGTLFLDEIGDMPLDVQPKLLRFLESGEVHPIGEAQPVHVDVRVIAATNANLDALVTDGRFREDLFYRLNIVRLHLPALRERRVEIPALANHYLQKYAHEYGKGDLRLAEETMEYLLLYRWPGNVRQLANEMRRMAALAETGAVLMPEHLSPEIAASRRTVPPSERVLDQNEVVVRLDQPMAAATEHLERAMLQYALDKAGGHMEETAALLGLSRKGLYLKRQRFGIDPPGEILPAAEIA